MFTSQARARSLCQARLSRAGGSRVSAESDVAAVVGAVVDTEASEDAVVGGVGGRSSAEVVSVVPLRSAVSGVVGVVGDGDGGPLRGEGGEALEVEDVGELPDKSQSQGH
eukprot:768338-Hanusia_phi.AAC.5